VTVAAGTAGPPARTPPDAADASAGAGEVGTRPLSAELTAVLGGARHDARFILDEVLGVGPGDRRPDVVPAAAAAAARSMAARRAAGEPLQYVFGHWAFRRLDLRVNPSVLIPRPETEQVVEIALSEARRILAAGPKARLVAVDAGTGSGAIALALATELGAAALEGIWATDTSPAALGVARANLEACRHAGAGPLPPMELLEGSWLTPLPGRLQGRVDLVVSNPPYVTEDEWAELPAEVRAEPRQALVAGPGRQGAGGLADVEAVLEQASLWLGRPGAVIVELAPPQAEAATDAARQLGYDEVGVEPDLAGRPRALVARRTGSE
jgi:release factor glutamine methyltransferase